MAGECRDPHARRCRVRGEDPGVAAAVPEVFSRVQIKYRNRNSDSRVFGVTPAYLDLLRYRMAAGSRFIEGNLKARRMVALLGAKAAEALFRGENPMGKFIKVRGRTFWSWGSWKRGASGWSCWRQVIGS
ncbi:ABC transporter permease [Candidatus Manganitrophus noduliformans]|uniref:ABC transporter permease n=1 Tax=Candidatus Manganitrophus noduliformans TaxID=2606439 RepID=UPI0015E3E2E8|nr:ABC transporter permease [Candidatus Manganitrophus noduliformans]